MKFYIEFYIFTYLKWIFTWMSHQKYVKNTCQSEPRPTQLNNGEEGAGAGAATERRGRATHKFDNRCMHVYDVSYMVLHCIHIMSMS